MSKMTTVDGTKRCLRCKTRKPHDQFAPNADSEDGKQAFCGDCRSAIDSSAKSIPCLAITSDGEKDTTLSKALGLDLQAQWEDFRIRASSLTQAAEGRPRENRQGQDVQTPSMNRSLIRARVQHDLNEEATEARTAHSPRRMRGGMQRHGDSTTPLSP